MKAPSERLYVTDLDGTLLKGDRTLSPYTVDVFNRLIRSGVALAYSTARSFNKAAALVGSIDFEVASIAYDGAMIVDPRAGATLDVRCVHPTVVQSLITLGGNFGVEPMILGRTDGVEVLVHPPPSNAAQAIFLKDRIGDPRMRPMTKLLPPDEVFALTFLGLPNGLLELKRLIEGEHASALSIRCAEDVYHPPFHALEILSREADKGQALRRLASSLGVAPDATTVFGDHLNDLPMFAVAGVRLAVNNAHPSVRDAADVIIGSNDEDGVARYLDTLIPD